MVRKCAVCGRKSSLKKNLFINNYVRRVCNVCYKKACISSYGKQSGWGAYNVKQKRLRESE